MTDATIINLAEFYKAKYHDLVLAEFEANCACHENDDVELVEVLSRQAWEATQAVNQAFAQWLTALGQKSEELVAEITRVAALMNAEEEATRRGDD